MPKKMEVLVREPYAPDTEFYGGHEPVIKGSAEYNGHGPDVLQVLTELPIQSVYAIINGKLAGRRSFEKNERGYLVKNVPALIGETKLGFNFDLESRLLQKRYGDFVVLKVQDGLEAILDKVYAKDGQGNVATFEQNMETSEWLGSVKTLDNSKEITLFGTVNGKEKKIGSIVANPEVIIAPTAELELPSIGLLGKRETDNPKNYTLTLIPLPSLKSIAQPENGGTAVKQQEAVTISVYQPSADGVEEKLGEVTLQLDAEEPTNVMIPFGDKVTADSFRVVAKSGEKPEESRTITVIK